MRRQSAPRKPLPRRDSNTVRECFSKSEGGRWGEAIGMNAARRRRGPCPSRGHVSPGAGRDRVLQVFCIAPLFFCFFKREVAKAATGMQQQNGGQPYAAADTIH